jgi:hypothetical protein
MRDEDVEINGIPFSEIFEAINLLQRADLDTSSVTMSLTHAMPEDDGEEEVGYNG